MKGIHVCTAYMHARLSQFPTHPTLGQVCCSASLSVVSCKNYYICLFSATNAQRCLSMPGLGASPERGERRFYFKVRGADACQAVSVPMHMNKLKVHGRESVAEALGLTFRPPRLSFSGNSRLPREPVDVDFDGYISLPGPEALGSIGSSPATAVEITPCRLPPGSGCVEDALM
jgi:hypothetical protein